MSTDTALWNIVENMPDSLKIELLQYAEYLMTKSSNLQREKKSEEITNKKGLAGSMKGTFVLPLSEDFDEPLEDFEDYM
ncbi:ABC transporter [Aphanothece sacrum FPU1]|uniref:ABC transporter n=2 Tax=Aphanothece sacrum TaxID=1122 RepID=A0A401IHT1_APHSA|nr:ABC transporter [Aphanothece sacrum FPU1]